MCSLQIEEDYLVTQTGMLHLAKSINAAVIANSKIFFACNRLHITAVGIINKQMKPLFFLTVVTVMVLYGCHKTSIEQRVSGNWQLVQKTGSIGPTFFTSEPAADSSVQLVLHANNTYVSKLNEQTVSQGNYSITTNTSYNNAKILELDNFITTGIFGLSTLYEIGTNGQVLSTYNGLSMTISNDTLTLQTALTPDGNTAYVLVKK